MYYILHIVLITCKTLVRPWWNPMKSQPLCQASDFKSIPPRTCATFPAPEPGIQCLTKFLTTFSWHMTAYDHKKPVQTYLYPSLYPYFKHIPMTNITIYYNILQSITIYYNILHYSNTCFYKSCNPTILWIEQEASITCWLSYLLKCGSHWGYHPISLVE